MIAQVDIAVSQGVTNAPDLLGPVMADAVAGDIGSMLLDGSGRVCKCSETAARMLGGGVADLESSPIWSFIAGIMSSDSSPSFNARYLVHLGNTGGWRHFQAIDLDGRYFSVELAMSKISSDGAGLFLLHLRQPSGT